MQTWDYRDKVTYWGAPVLDGWGSKTFNAPVVLMGRWEDRHEQFIGLSGVTEVSRAHVWLTITPDLGGYLLRGESTEVDPTSLAVAFEVRMTREIPDLRGNFVERKTFL